MVRCFILPIPEHTTFNTDSYNGCEVISKFSMINYRGKFFNYTGVHKLFNPVVDGTNGYIQFTRNFPIRHSSVFVEQM